MTISTKKPLYAEVHNVPDDYEFTDEELNRIIAGDMFTPRQDAIMAREIQKLRAAMLHGAEPVKQTYKLPPLSSSEVNDAAWKLHNMLTEHVPLNGRQFNNLKGCFYEALKVAMRNSPVTPDGWISCSERMPDKLIPVMVMYEDGEMWSAMWNGNRWDDGTEYPDPHSVTHWREMPAAPQQEVK